MLWKSSNGVTVNGTPGQSGATVVIAVPLIGAGVARYHCAVHGNGMGNSITTQDAQNTPPVLTATSVDMNGLSFLDLSIN